MKLRHYITTGISVGLILGWLLFLALPVKKKHADIIEKAAQAESQLSDFNRIMATLPDYFNSRNEIDQKKEKLLSMLIPKKDIMKLFDKIEVMALKGNVTVKEISPSVEELLFLNRQLPDDNRPQVLEIGLKLDGSIQQIGQLIKNIEDENFYKGISFCRIYNHLDNHRNSDVHFGFKAILGTIKES